jgi:hypothetical protein
VKRSALGDGRSDDRGDGHSQRRPERANVVQPSDPTPKEQTRR